MFNFHNELDQDCQSGWHKHLLLFELADHIMWLGLNIRRHVWYPWSWVLCFLDLCDVNYCVVDFYLGIDLRMKTWWYSQNINQNISWIILLTCLSSQSFSRQAIQYPADAKKCANQKVTRHTCDYLNPMLADRVTTLKPPFLTFSPHPMPSHGLF